MGNSQGKAKITAQDKAILDLKLQRDKIKQYQRKVQGILDREREIAKEALKQGNKSRALTALRRRKYQESLLDKTDNQLESLQALVSNIEFALVEKDVIFGLQQGNSVLKQLHSEMTLENVEKLMGETQEAIAYQKELDEMLGSRMSADEEDQVQAELEAMQAEQMAVELPDAPQGERLPNVPDTPIQDKIEADKGEEVQERQRERQALPA